MNITESKINEFLTLKDLVYLHDNGRLDCNALFQRDDKQWNEKKKRKFLFNLIKPINGQPYEFHISLNKLGDNYRLVDGLQRISSVLSFIKGEQYIEYPITGNKFKRLYYKDLSTTEKDTFLNVYITFSPLSLNMTDEQIRGYFIDINDGKPVSKSIKRNAKISIISDEMAKIYNSKINNKISKSIIIELLEALYLNVESLELNNEFSNITNYKVEELRNKYKTHLPAQDNIVKLIFNYLMDINFTNKVNATDLISMGLLFYKLLKNNSTLPTPQDFYKMYLSAVDTIKATNLIKWKISSIKTKNNLEVRNKLLLEEFGKFNIFKKIMLKKHDLTL